MVSGSGSAKIIAIPKLSGGKAGPTSEAITFAVRDWAINDDIVALCFDSTPVNTGEHTGICVRLEMTFGHQFIHLACRHHIMELILVAVFSALLPEQSKSPNIYIFLNFRNVWSLIDKKQYATTLDDDTTAARFNP